MTTDSGTTRQRMRQAVCLLFAGPFGAPHLLAWATLAAPALALTVPLGMAPLFIGTATLVLALSWRQRPWTRVPAAIVVLLAAIVAWAAVSAAWAVDPARSLRTAAVLAAEAVLGVSLLGVALGLDRRDRDRLAAALAAGLAAGLALYVADLLLLADWTAFRQGRLYDYSQWVRHANRGITVMALLTGPAFVMLERRGHRRAAWALVAAIGAAALLSVTLSGKIAFGLSLLALLAFGGRRRIPGRLLGGALVLAVFAVPLAAAMLPGPQETARWKYITYSAHHRLSIWSFTAQRIVEKPLLGWGMDASRALPGADDEVEVAFEAFSLVEPNLPLHPHNAVLQWWVELGAAGGVLFALLLWRLSRLAAAPRDLLYGNAALAMLASAMAVAAVSYGFWQTWWQGTLWLLAAWMAAAAPAPSD